MLKIENVNSGYDILQVLWDVNLNIQECEFVALLGPNGAGKSTTLKTIAGLVKPMSGEIYFKDKNITGLPAHEITKLGISYISESLNLFRNMSIQENLLMGAYIIEDEKEKESLLQYTYELFPRLAERKKQLAGTLSGGERRNLF